MSKYYIKIDGNVVDTIELNKDEISSFKKSNPHATITKEIDKDALDSLEEEKNNDASRASRLAEYPPIGDQLDAIMKWLSTETEFGIPAELKSLAGKCMSVKAKYPIKKK